VFIKDTAGHPRVHVKEIVIVALEVKGATILPLAAWRKTPCRQRQKSCPLDFECYNNNLLNVNTRTPCGVLDERGYYATRCLASDSKVSR